MLVEPEIPPNTGNVARLCAATRSPLHLVEPLGFRIDERAVRRAGLDYWHLVNVQCHPDYRSATQTVAEQCPEARCWLLSAKSSRSYLDVRYRPGDALVFGKESQGLPDALVQARPDRTLGIPTLGGVRSLNLANCVAIVLYEALRQVGALANPRLG